MPLAELGPGFFSMYWLTACSSLPRKEVWCPAMTVAVDLRRNAIKQNKNKNTKRHTIHFPISVILLYSYFPLNYFPHYSKTCLNQLLKIDKTKILVANGSTIEVETNAELWSILQYFDLHSAIIGLENKLLVFVSGRFRQNLLQIIANENVKTK